MKHGIDHRDNIQRTTGDRAFFQDTETDIKRKDIYRDKWKRITYTDMDSHDIAFDNKMAP